jgi:hypothetical protein
MRILLTNKQMVGGTTGTETVVRDLVVGLRRSGHTVVTYAPQVGRAAAVIRQTGSAVATSLLDVAETPDIIHGHHTGPTMAALARFPNVPAVFVCHDFSAEYDDPPLHPRIRRYLYVRESLKGRLCDERGIDPAQTSLWLNTIDLHRIGPAAPVPRVLRTAAIFAHPGAITQPEIFARICERSGISFKGDALSKPTARPLEAIRGIDLVFASGLMAIEALAAGHVVVNADRFGVGGLVTYERLEHFGKWNFAIGGLSLHPDLSGLNGELAAYDPADADRVCNKIRSDWCIEKGIERLERIYREVVFEAKNSPLADRESEGIVIAKFIENYMRDVRVYDQAFLNKRAGFSDFQGLIENLSSTNSDLIREIQKLRRRSVIRWLWDKVSKRN